MPKSRVAYVPSAAMLVRRAAAGAGFDERMHVAEDVDLVLRLHAAGWRLRYEPAARVAHDHRTGVRAWWLRKAYYGTGAAPLALRHPGSVPPMVLNTWSAAVAVLLLRGRPWAVLAAVAVVAGATEQLARKLPVREPRRTAARLIGLGTVGTVTQTADAVTRHYWPLALVAALVSRRARRTVAVIAVAEGVLDWWRKRDRPRPARPARISARPQARRPRLRRRPVVGRPAPRHARAAASGRHRGRWRAGRERPRAGRPRALTPRPCHSGRDPTALCDHHRPVGIGPDR